MIAPSVFAVLSVLAGIVSGVMRKTDIPVSWPASMATASSLWLYAAVFFAFLAACLALAEHRRWKVVRAK